MLSEVTMSDSLPYEKMDLFYLGREVDTETGSTSMLPFLYKNKHLTTHAAILGMTGSGKTGLGVCLLEEAAPCFDGVFRWLRSWNVGRIHRG